MKVIATAVAAFVLAPWSTALLAAEKGGTHHPRNHVGFVAGLTYEEKEDGHRENGNVLGIEYIRRNWKHWGVGVSYESEVFGNDLKRHGILAVPVSYFPGGAWRLFGAPGIEFREDGESDKTVFRLGAGYEFELGHPFTISPEAQVDFVAGGTTVYVLALTLGYGF